MSPIGQKEGEPVPDLSRFDSRGLYWLAARCRHAKHGCRVGWDKEDGALGVPSTTERTSVVAASSGQRQRSPARDPDPFQFLVGEKPNGPAVRRPEGIPRAVCPRDRLRGFRLEPTEPQLSISIGRRCEYQLAPVG